MPAFLDPDRPIHTCERTDCEGCALHGKLACHFNGKQLKAFLLSCLPVIAAGLFVTAPVSLLAPVGWLVCFLLYFGLIEIRVMCSHCPHYAEPETRTLKCWANYGSPKLWKYRPGPMSAAERIVFFAGLFVIVLYPVPFGVIAGRFVPLAVYLALALTGAVMLRRFLCVKCFNFACPLNRVDAETRNAFLQCNPGLRKAWREKEPGSD